MADEIVDIAAMEIDQVLPNLSPREKRFCEEYLVDLISKHAAARAGVPKASTMAWAANTLKKPFVKRYIELLMEGAAARSQVMVDRVVVELAYIAFGDISNLVSWDDKEIKVKPSDQLKKHLTAMIQEVGYGQNGGVKVKTHDKIKALELLMKHLGMINPRASEGTDEALDGLVNVLQAARVRTRLDNMPVVEGSDVDPNAPEDPAFLIEGKQD